MSNEDEYFAKLEAEKKARMADLLGRADAVEEAARLKELHFNHCGKCGHAMLTSHYKGVEIEVCPDCGAVLLDPGELEQLAGPERQGAVHHIARLFSFHPDKQ